MYLFDKNGKKFKVPHAVDRKEWIASGKYFTESPKEGKQPQQNQDDRKSLID